jgi:hypothetical protein
MFPGNVRIDSVWHNDRFAVKWSWKEGERLSFLDMPYAFAATEAAALSEQNTSEAKSRSLASRCLLQSDLSFSLQSLSPLRFPASPSLRFMSSGLLDCLTERLSD